MNILAELQPIFRDIFDDESITVTNESSAENMEDWDSLVQVRLVMAISRHFGLRFELDELAHLKNVGEMCELIAKKLAAKNA